MAAAPGSQPLTDAARRKNPIMTVEVWRVGVDVSGKKLKEPDGLPARLGSRFDRRGRRLIIKPEITIVTCRYRHSCPNCRKVS